MFISWYWIQQERLTLCVKETCTHGSFHSVLPSDSRGVSMGCRFVHMGVAAVLPWDFRETPCRYPNTKAQKYCWLASCRHNYSCFRFLIDDVQQQCLCVKPHRCAVRYIFALCSENAENMTPNHVRNLPGEQHTGPWALGVRLDRALGFGCSDGCR